MSTEILDKGWTDEEFDFQDDVKSYERWGAMFLDHVLICFMSLPLLILYDNHFGPIGTMEFVLIIVLYMNKDILNSKSIAKRLTGQIIIDTLTEKPASSIKCVIRNFTILLWPVEVIAVLIYPKTRIGDVIAGTKVVRSKKQNNTSFFEEISSVKIESLVYPILIGFVFNFLFFFYVFDQILFRF